MFSVQFFEKISTVILCLQRYKFAVETWQGDYYVEKDLSRNHDFIHDACAYF